jgi:hypothetical protein
MRCGHNFCIYYRLILFFEGYWPYLMIHAFAVHTTIRVSLIKEGQHLTLATCHTPSAPILFRSSKWRCWNTQRSNFGHSEPGFYSNQRKHFKGIWHTVPEQIVRTSIKRNGIRGTNATDRTMWNNLLESSVGLTFRHRASSILGQAFRYSPENAFYIFNQQIYFIIWYLFDRASLI